MQSSRTKFSWLIIFCFSAGITYAQESQKVLQLPKASADCNGAIMITDKLGPVRNCTGPGYFEMRNQGAQNPYLMQYELNPAWYRFSAEESGELHLKITSINPADDYNFAIYVSPGPWFCSTFENEQMNNPLRANMSTADASTGITGTDAVGTEDFVDISGNPFCKPLTVNAGDLIYLYIDSKTKPQNGYTIEIRVMEASKQ